MSNKPTDAQQFIEDIGAGVFSKQFGVAITKVIRLRLIVNAGDQDPIFAIQIVREELLKNDIIQEFKEKVIELLPANPVRIGTFKA